MALEDVLFSQILGRKQAEATRKSLLGLQEPLQPEELISALMESAGRRGVDVPPSNLLNLLRSAQSQDVGQRRLFTETGDLLSQRLPFVTPEVQPGAQAIQQAVERAALPPSRARLLEDLAIQKEIKASQFAPEKELYQKVLTKGPKGEYKYRSLAPGETFQLGKGEELVSPREPGGAVSETQLQRTYLGVLSRAQSMAAQATKLKFPQSSFTFNSFTGEMVIGQNTPPEALQYFQDQFKAQGRAMTKKLPGVREIFDAAFPEEPVKPSESPEGAFPMSDADRTLNSFLFDSNADIDVVSYIQQQKRLNVPPEAIVSKLQSLGVIK